MTGTYLQAWTRARLQNLNRWTLAGSGWVLPLLLSGVALGAVSSAAAAQSLSSSGNSVTYTIPFQPAYGSVVYSRPTSGSVTFGSGTVQAQVGVSSTTYYPGYPGYPTYPTGTVLVPNSRRIRNVNNSVLVSPTIIDGRIRNSTLVNPTIVNSPRYAYPRQNLPTPMPGVTSPLLPQTINFPPIQYFPPAPNIIIIQTGRP